MSILVTALALATAAPAPAAQAAPAPAAPAAHAAHADHADHADHAKMKHGDGKECCCKDMAKAKAGTAATKPATQSEHQH